jgi:hypothetical protein
MKILAMEVEVPGVTGEKFRPYLEAEAARVWELYQAGVVRELYFRPDRHTAVLMLECVEPDAAYQALSSLPLVRAGLITFEVIPLAPYDGFARLFAK